MGMGKKVDFDECRLQMEKPLSAINLSEDSEGDSDQRQLFELPKRKVIRPTTSSFKKRIGSSKTTCCGRTGLCCKVCFSTLVPIFIATFVAFTIIFFIVLTMGMSGINKELNGLKVKISYAEDAEKDFNAKRDKLRKDYENKLVKLSNEQNKIQGFKSQIDGLKDQIKTLNSSLQRLRSHPALDVASVKSDLDKLKTGMADTGSAISKLENTHTSLVTRVGHLEKTTKTNSDKLFNVTVRVSKLERSAPPAPRSTTAKRLVVTLTPGEDTPVKEKDFKRAISDLEKKQNAICDEQSEHLMKEISSLRNQTLYLNQTYSKKFVVLSQQIEANKGSNEALKTTPVTTTAQSLTTGISRTPSKNLQHPSTTAQPTKVNNKLDDLDSLSKNFHESGTTDTLLGRRDVENLENEE